MLYGNVKMFVYPSRVDNIFLNSVHSINKEET